MLIVTEYAALSYFKFGSVVQEEMLFKQKAYTLGTHDGWRRITIAHPEPSAPVS